MIGRSSIKQTIKSDDVTCFWFYTRKNMKWINWNRGEGHIFLLKTDKLKLFQIAENGEKTTNQTTNPTRPVILAPCRGSSGSRLNSGPKSLKIWPMFYPKT